MKFKSIVRGNNVLSKVTKRQGSLGAGWIKISELKPGVIVNLYFPDLDYKRYNNLKKISILGHFAPNGIIIGYINDTCETLIKPGEILKSIYKPSHFSIIQDGPFQDI